jgi:hypothetical protein
MLECMAVSASRPRAAGQPSGLFFDGVCSYENFDKVGGMGVVG